MSYFLSLVIGLGVGVIYGLLRVKSPAPPIVALVGLLGMVLGESGIQALLRIGPKP
jgi:XapX domain-containing protein